MHEFDLNLLNFIKSITNTQKGSKSFITALYLHLCVVCVEFLLGEQALMYLSTQCIKPCGLYYKWSTYQEEYTKLSKQYGVFTSLSSPLSSQKVQMQFRFCLITNIYIIYHYSSSSIFFIIPIFENKILSSPRMRSHKRYRTDFSSGLQWFPIYYQQPLHAKKV